MRGSALGAGAWDNPTGFGTVCDLVVTAPVSDPISRVLDKGKSAGQRRFLGRLVADQVTKEPHP